MTGERITSLDERKRQFAAVCRFKFNVAGACQQHRLNTDQKENMLTSIGKNRFGLTGHEVRICRARARNFLGRVDEKAISRAAAGRPATSDQMIIELFGPGELLKVRAREKPKNLQPLEK